MDFYDVAHPQSLAGSAHKSLGFKSIYSIGTDVKLVELGKNSSEVSDSICIGMAGEPLCSAAKGAPKAILIRDSRIDRKLLEIMKSREVALCIAFDGVMASSGLRRSSQLYMMSKLVEYALKKRMQVAFVTLARSEEMLCSPIQLIELAKLLGVPNDYARKAISETNKQLMQ